jgi:nitroreductase
MPSAVTSRTADNIKPNAIKGIAESRRSIRKFLQEPMDQADLREILRLTSLAPSANNLQPWRFVVVQDRKWREKLLAASNNQQQILSAPANIIIYSDIEDVVANAEEIFHPGLGEENITSRAQSLRKAMAGRTSEQRQEYAHAQANIALGYLLLIARGFGYDTSPMLGVNQEKVKELFGLPAHARLTAVVALGKRAEDGFSHHRHALQRITTFY